jgi:hypothetical protein
MVVMVMVVVMVLMLGTELIGAIKRVDPRPYAHTPPSERRGVDGDGVGGWRG